MKAVNNFKDIKKLFETTDPAELEKKVEEMKTKMNPDKKGQMSSFMKNKYITFLNNLYGQAEGLAKDKLKWLISYVKKTKNFFKIVWETFCTWLSLIWEYSWDFMCGIFCMIKDIFYPSESDQTLDALSELAAQQK